MEKRIQSYIKMDKKNSLSSHLSSRDFFFSIVSYILWKIEKKERYNYLINVIHEIITRIAINISHITILILQAISRHQILARV